MHVGNSQTEEHSDVDGVIRIYADSIVQVSNNGSKDNVFLFCASVPPSVIGATAAKYHPKGYSEYHVVVEYIMDEALRIIDGEDKVLFFGDEFRSDIKPLFKSNKWYQVIEKDHAFFKTF